MYINYGGAQYPCRCRPGAAMVYRGLPTDFPAPVTGPVALCNNDGFELRVDDPADYLRQTFAGGVLTLTNAPEPTPEPEPGPEPAAETVTVEDLAAAVLTLQADVILLKEGVDGA